MGLKDIFDYLMRSADPEYANKSDKMRDEGRLIPEIDCIEDRISYLEKGLGGKNWGIVSPNINAQARRTRFGRQKRELILPNTE